MSARRFFRRYFVFVGCLIGGLALLMVAAWPFISYWLMNHTFLNNELISPVPHHQLRSHHLAHAGPQIIDDLNTIAVPVPEIIDENLHYTDLSNWFDSSLNLSFDRTDITYTLDIPSLGIRNALVRVGGLDLDNNLIQFEASPFPGEYGAPVIFGHSMLRQFYDPRESNPRRYMSIFSTIMTMEPGDKIYVTFQGIRFTYEVLWNRDVMPDDPYILAQDYSDRFLKLVTCTPEGTYLRRGVVTARLVP
ncbi:MAG: sortase [Pseudomonadales bacterium]|nr:sortase [Pseudomonadales bacterium]